MSKMSRRTFLKIGALTVAGAGLASCVRPSPEPQDSATAAPQEAATPQDSSSSTPQADEAAISVQEITVSEVTYDGELYNVAAENLPGITFWPISFAYTLAFLRKNVVGAAVFDPNSIPFLEGEVELQPQPRGASSTHYFTIFRTPTAQAANAAGLVQGYATSTFVDQNGNSVSEIPAGETEWDLTLKVVEALFKTAVDPQADGHFATEGLPETLGQSYAAAYLAGKLGNSYDGYVSFTTHLRDAGFVDNDLVPVTFDAYTKLTWGMYEGDLPGLFTFQTAQ